MDTAEAEGWVWVPVVDGAGCTRRVGEVRGGLGDVRETGFPPSNFQSTETRRWGGARHSLETEPRTRRGRARSTAVLSAAPRGHHKVFPLLRKSRVSPGYNVCCNPGGGGGAGNRLFVRGQDSYKQHFSQQHPKKSLLLSYWSVRGSLLGRRDHTKRNNGNWGED